MKALLQSSLLLAIAPGLALCAQADDEQAAARAVAARRHAEARTIYESLESRYPERTDYTIQAARLSGWMGEYAAAIRAYDRALQREPENVEALVGKARVLLWDKKYPEAERILTVASRLAPESAEVSLTWARRYYYAGNTEAATRYVKRALAQNPGDAEALELQANLSREPSLELTAGYGFDRFSFFSAGHSGFTEGAWLRRSGRIAARFEEWSRFGRRATRGGFSASHRLGSGWGIHGAVIAGSDGAVFATRDFTTGANRKLGGGFVAGADYRYLKFDQAAVHVVSPSLEYYFERPSWITAAVSWARTGYTDERLRNNGNTSFRLMYFHGLTRRAVLSGGYARGTENFAGLSFDRTGRFLANTYIGGGRIRLSSSVTASADYAWQDRSTGATQHSASVRLTLQK